MMDIHVGDRVDILEKYKFWRDEAITCINRAHSLRVKKIRTNCMGTFLYLENPELSAGFVCVRKILVELSKSRKVRRLQ